MVLGGGFVGGSQGVEARRTISCRRQRAQHNQVVSSAAGSGLAAGCKPLKAWVAWPRLGAAVQPPHALQRSTPKCRQHRHGQYTRLEYKLVHAHRNLSGCTRT
eukprot:359258-Chlamydomonas_euryale.AAC.17